MLRFLRAFRIVFFIVSPALIFGAALLPHQWFSFLIWAVASLTGGSLIYLLINTNQASSGLSHPTHHDTLSGPALSPKILEVLEHIPQAMIVLDRKQRIIYRNSQSVHLLGSLPLQRDITGLIRTPSFIQAVSDCYRQKSGQTLEFNLLSPRRISILVSLAPFLQGTPGPSTSPMAVLMLVQDLTMIKSIEEMRSDFVTNASHELKTPLTSMIGFVDTLIQDPTIDQSHRAEFLTIMKQQAERMYRLVEDMLILSKIEQNEHVLPRQMVDLSSVLSDVVRSLKTQAKQNQMKLKLFENKQPLVIKADEEQMFQLFQNLIQNAIKYSHHGDTIDIALNLYNDDAIVFSVRDHGPGIQKEHIPRLTERFYRVDKGRSRELGGTGLGLAIVKHIVSHHRGRLDITSEQGQGTEFRVVLPCEKPKEQG